jgi:transcription elongation factor Elf1
MALVTHTSNPPLRMHRPICPNCNEEMWLVHIVHVEAHLDKYSFECAICQKSEDEMVERAW